MNLIKVLVSAAAAAFLSLGAAQAGQFNDGPYNDDGNQSSCSGGGGTSSCTPLQLTGTATNGAVRIWNFKCSGGLSAACADALPSNPNLINSGSHKTLVYSGLYTGGINFSDTSHDTIGAFIASAGGSFNATVSNTVKGLTLSTGFSNPPGCYSSCTPRGRVTIMEFTFTIASSQDLYIQHDDGVSVWDSTNTIDYLDSSNPTSVIISSVLLGAGTYNLWYAEVNGLPADLITCLVPHVDNTPVPEPLTLSLFGAGLAGAAALRRRRKVSTAA